MNPLFAISSLLFALHLEYAQAARSVGYEPFNPFQEQNSDDNYDYILDESPRGEVERLLRDYSQNQDLVRSMGSRYYQVVYPVQTRHQSDTNTRAIDPSQAGIMGPDGQQLMGGISTTGGATGPGPKTHFRKTSLLIKAFQHKFRIDLELNTRLLAPNIRQKGFLKEGAVSVSQQDLEHCYYHGTVKDFSGGEYIPGSMAALQTCNGVSGSIHLGNETFVIHPFFGGDLSNKHPHVIYEYSDKSPQGCAVTGASYDAAAGKRKKRSTLEQFEHLIRQKRDMRSIKKFIEVALVLDESMFDLRRDASRKDVIHDAIQVANIADLYFKHSLNSRLSIVYIETWQEQNQVAGFSRQRNINQALVDFSDYVSRKMFAIEKDTTQLLTGQRYENGRSTISTVGTICTPKAVGISVDIDLYEPHILAANLAHSIGHNLGLHHDSDDSSSSTIMGLMSGSNGNNNCGCQDWHGCIMKASVIGDDGVQPYKFSTCSLDQFQLYMNEGHARCLRNLPNQLGRIDNCGNGKIDEGEDCDCVWDGDECKHVDMCCNPNTCRLLPEAQCSNGPCCVNCKLREAGTPCRLADNSCDLTELCTGTSGECPQDLYVKNAEPCTSETGGEGYCYNGRCPTKNDQCRSIWGRGGEEANEACFVQFNSGGSMNGNCGKPRYSGAPFKPCERENVMCGTLHCQNGKHKPIIDQSTYSSHSSSVGGEEVQCKFMSTAYEDGMEDFGMVGDGSKCGDKKICMNQTCISIHNMESYTVCPGNAMGKECSDNGVCSNRNTCVCNDGYGGPDCSRRVMFPITPATMSPNGERPTPQSWDDTTANVYILKESDSDTVLMVIALVAVVGGVFILFALMALCYRRKSALPNYEPPYMKRRMMLKGYAHPNSPHPSAHMTPDHTFDDTAAKLSLAGFPGAGSMGTPMPPPGSMPAGYGDQHMAQMKQRMDSHRNLMGMGSNPMLVDPSFQSEKGGILKKPGLPYGGIPPGHGDPHAGVHHSSLDKDKWMDEAMVDRYNQGQGSVGGPGGPGSRLDRISTSSQSQLTEQQQQQQAAASAIAVAQALRASGSIPHDARSLSEVERTLKNLNGYHEGLLEALRNAAKGGNAGNGRDGERGSSASHRGSNASSGGGQMGGGGGGGQTSAQQYGAHRSSNTSLADELRKQLAADNFLESYEAAQAQTRHTASGRQSSQGGGVSQGGALVGADLVAAMAATLKRSSREKLDNVPNQSGDETGRAGLSGLLGDGSNQPMRIRNLEDLIRQLEQSSRHMSPNGSEDIRESEAERHFRNLNLDREDSLFGGGVAGANLGAMMAMLQGQAQQGVNGTSMGQGVGFPHPLLRNGGGVPGERLISSNSSSHMPPPRRRSSGALNTLQGTGNSQSPGGPGSAASTLRMRQRGSGHHLDNRLGSSSSPPPHPTHQRPASSRSRGQRGIYKDRDADHRGPYDPTAGVDTISPGDPGGLTPGSTFDASEVDSEDFLRAQLMRSTSDEAVHSKSEDLDDEVDSIRSPFYKPGRPTAAALARYPLSPQSPPTDEGDRADDDDDEEIEDEEEELEEGSSYQGSTTGPSDRSYNGGGPNGGGGGSGGGQRGLRSGGLNFAADHLDEALLKSYMNSSNY